MWLINLLNLGQISYLLSNILPRRIKVRFLNLIKKLEKIREKQKEVEGMNNEAIDYPCTSFGPFRVPYFSLVENVENPYKEKDVEVMVSEKKFQIPDKKVRKFMEENVKKREERTKKEGKVFFDGPLVRLYNYVVDDENHKLELDVQRTSYFTFAFTNKSLDEEIVWQMVKKRGKEYENLDDGLANP